MQAVIGPIVLLIQAIIGRMVRFVQRLLVGDGRKALTQDPRPPVLFLRSFDDDSAGLSKHMTSVIPIREEQTLEHMFRAVGPCVAVKAPGRALAESGAARIRFKGTEWQQGVSELLDICRLVVVRIGVGSGLLWEVQQILRKIAPHKVILYIGSHDREIRWATFTDAVSSFWPATLPKDIGDSTFVTFGDGWRPVLKGKGGGWSDPSFKVPGTVTLVILSLVNLMTPFGIAVATVARNTIVAFSLTVVFAGSHAWMWKTARRMGVVSAQVYGLAGIVVIVLGWGLRIGESTGPATIILMALFFVFFMLVLWRLRIHVLSAVAMHLQLVMEE